jgi:hypothetical protein
MQSELRVNSAEQGIGFAQSLESWEFVAPSEEAVRAPIPLTPAMR